MEKYITNATPALTWTWLKLNKDEISLENNFSQSMFEIGKTCDGFEIIQTDENSINIPQAKSSVFNPLPKKEMDHRKQDGTFYTKEEYTSLTKQEESEHPFTKLINNTCKNVQLITVKGTPESPLILNLANQKDKNIISKQIINVTKNSDATIIFMYESNEDENTQIIQTKVFVQENAKLHLVKAQLAGKNTLHLDDTGIICQEDAKVCFTQIELGANHIDSGLYVDLLGNRSTFNSKVSYLCKDNQYLDMNHLVCQWGKRTECIMDVDGTLKDNCKKIYRGTLDLKKGCAGSKGNEMENTLILSPSAINRSMPNILCTEEDIAAEHGSTIGRLSQEILFYMQTRGIGLEEAEKIISIAKIQKAVSLIGDDEIQKKIIAFLGESEE